MSVRIDGNLLLEILEETPATQNIMLMGKHGIGNQIVVMDLNSLEVSLNQKQNFL